MEEKIKQSLLKRGFTEETLLNNRGLTGAVIDETEKNIVTTNTFTLDDMRKAFLAGRDSVEAELDYEPFGDMDAYAKKKYVKSFKTFIHETYNKRRSCTANGLPAM